MDKALDDVIVVVAAEVVIVVVVVVDFSVAITSSICSQISILQPGR